MSSHQVDLPLPSPLTSTPARLWAQLQPQHRSPSEHPGSTQTLVNFSNYTPRDTESCTLPKGKPANDNTFLEIHIVLLAYLRLCNIPK